MNDPQSRADRYLARVRAHLPTLPDDAARRAFLAQQAEAWDDRYARFQASEGGSAPGATAFDYVCTISGLAALRTGVLA
jgi:hypothetical protein